MVANKEVVYKGWELFFMILMIIGSAMMVAGAKC